MKYTTKNKKNKIIEGENMKKLNNGTYLYKNLIIQRDEKVWKIINQGGSVISYNNNLLWKISTRKQAKSIIDKITTTKLQKLNNCGII